MSYSILLSRFTLGFKKYISQQEIRLTTPNF